MPRIRYIKPGFFTNEDLGEAPAHVRLAFAGLWCWADRSGRMEDRPARLKAQILPYDAVDFALVLDELVTRGFITRYAVAGRKYIEINKFAAHQKVHPKEPPSELPAPLVNCDGTSRGKKRRDSVEPGFSPASNCPDTVAPPSSRSLTLTGNSNLTVTAAPSGETSGNPQSRPNPQTRKRTPPSGPHAECVAAFCEAWESRYGEKYPFNGGRDGATVKAILGHLGQSVERFRAAVGRYFADESAFVRDARHTLGIFQATLARYLADGQPAAKKDTKAGLREYAQRRGLLPKEWATDGD